MDTIFKEGLEILILLACIAFLFISAIRWALRNQDNGSQES